MKGNNKIRANTRLGVVFNTENIYLNLTVSEYPQGGVNPELFFGELSKVIMTPRSQFIHQSLYDADVYDDIMDLRTTTLGVIIANATESQKTEVYYLRQNSGALEFATGYAVEEVAYAVVQIPIEPNKLVSINFNFNDMIVLYSNPSPLIASRSSQSERSAAHPHNPSSSRH